MRQRKSLAAMLVLVFVSSGLSGCLGDEGLDLLPEKKGVPGGLVLACLRSSMYTSMVIEIDHEPGYRPYSTRRWQVLFPSGVYEEDSVLGVAVDASTVALFSDTIEEADGPFGRPSVEDVENSVLVHEVGHLLGLVNLVYQSPIDHEDPDHPGHSSNDESVMYWAVESADVSNFIFGTLPSDFDDDDRSDLAGLADGSIAVRDQLWP